MNLLCLSSPKGGVGKTTLTANLAFALQRLGYQVVAIDFDVQNALRLHFGMSLDDGRGYVAEALEVEDWQRLVIDTPSGVGLLPYGSTTGAQRARFELALQQDPEFLARRLGPVLRRPDVITLVDLPPGPSPGLSAMAGLGATFVAVLLADSASLSTLPGLESGAFFGPQVREHFYVINQTDMRRRLNRDVTEFLQDRLGSPLLGMVHRDEAIAEANAVQTSLFDYAPGSAAVYDLDNIARNVSRLLPERRARGALSPLPS